MSCKFVVYVDDLPIKEFDTFEEAEQFARGYEDVDSEDLLHESIEVKIDDEDS